MSTTREEISTLEKMSNQNKQEFLNCVQEKKFSIILFVFLSSINNEPKTIIVGFLNPTLLPSLSSEQPQQNDNYIISVILDVSLSVLLCCTSVFNCSLETQYKSKNVVSSMNLISFNLDRVL